MVVVCRKLAAANYIVNVLAIARKRAIRDDVTKQSHRAHCCDAIRVYEGIHSSMEQISCFQTPAGIGIGCERGKKECKSIKECGRHGHLGCIKKNGQNSQSRTLGTFL